MRQKAPSSSFTEPGKVTDFKDYLGRAKEGQEEIYFQIGQGQLFYGQSQADPVSGHGGQFAPAYPQ